MKTDCRNITGTETRKGIGAEIERLIDDQHRGWLGRHPGDKAGEQGCGQSEMVELYLTEEDRDRRRT